ncbi:hypothetical protein F5Y18DRAFT_52712 [Xylariaceae sp. FL1019]|nr:hypothetical protein F5Y18DRAFT_52712 [Xylariaceae sp. FL1019]
MRSTSFRRKVSDKVSNLFKRRGDRDPARSGNTADENKKRSSLSSETISPPIISQPQPDRTSQGPQSARSRDENNQLSPSSARTAAEARWNARASSSQLPPGLHLRDRDPRELQRRFGLEHCKPLEECARCGNWFTESHNSELACMWHPGTSIPHPPSPAVTSGLHSLTRRCA